MKDKPKLLKKLQSIEWQIDRIRNYLNGKKEDYEKDAVFEPDSIMSEALRLVRDSTEFLQNVGTSWRKEKGEK